MSNLLYNRDIKLIVEDFQINNLHISFSITKDLTSTPNTGLISIYNLSETSRNKIKKTSDIEQNVKGSIVVFEAGYKDFIEQIFIGEVTEFRHNKEKVDWVTELEVKDGYTSYAKAIISKAYKAGTQLSTIVSDTIEQMGLSSNVSTVETELNSKKFDRGFVENMSSKDLLDKYVKLIDARWTIQDNKVIILKNNKALKPTAIVISKETGLINSVQKIGDGYIFKTLINPKLQPGQLVQFDTNNYQNQTAIIEKAVYTGSNFQNDYYAEIEATEV